VIGPIRRRTPVGDLPLLTTTEASATTTIEPGSGEQELKFVARYEGDWARVDEAMGGLRAAAERAKAHLPPEAHEALDAAVKAREAAVRSRAPRKE